MRLFRRHSYGLSWLASLVLLVGTLASMAVPHPAQSAGKQVYDAVLGWMPLCAPSQAGKSNGGEPQHTQGAAHGCCAFACAAAAAPVALAEFLPTLSDFPETPTADISTPESPGGQPRLGFGTLGSRGPPLHA